MQRLLITGTAGEIGQDVLPYLERDYSIRGFDRLPTPGCADFVVGDIRDFDTISAAMEGVDAVLHLAYPAGGVVFNDWDSVLNDGLDGTYNVFTSAVEHGIRKIIYASTAKVNRMDSGKREFFTHRLLPTPMDLYAGGKLMGESLAQTFTALHAGLDIICLRIGTIRNLPLITDTRMEPDHLSWCHPEDLAQLIHRSIQTPGLGFQVFFGISLAGARRWDLGNAQRLVGYWPVHHADDHFVIDGLEELPFTRNQRMVLRAALLGDTPAGNAVWKRWAATLDRRLQIPGHEAVFELLPLACRAAGEHPEDAKAEERILLDRMAGVTKQSWYQTQLYLEAANTLADQLRAHSIQAVFLGDLAARQLLYPGEQVRKVGQILVIVDPASHERTCELLASLGWEASSENPSPSLRQFKLGPVRLAVRNNFAPYFALPWSLVMDHTLQVDGLTFPDHNLFFLTSCWQAVDGWKSESLLATVDSYRLLCASDPQLSHQVLLDLSRRGNVRAGLFYGLHQLHRLTGDPIVSRFFRQLLALRLSRRERLLAWLIASQQGHRSPQFLRRKLRLNGVGFRS